MSSKNDYSWFATKGLWKFLGFAITYWAISSIFTGGDKLRVLNCLPNRESIAYNTKTGKLFRYDSFKEAWVPRKLTDYKSKNSGNAYFKSNRSENIKLESFFVNGNLKIKQENRKRGSMYGANSNNLGSTYDYVDVNTMIVYDGKKERKTYRVKENNNTFTCKLDRQKMYRAPVETYSVVE